MPQPPAKILKTGDELSSEEEDESSPEKRRKNAMGRKFGQGPGLMEPTVDVQKFLEQLENVNKLTMAILPSVEDTSIKAALQQLANISTSCGILIRKEKVSTQQTMEEEKRKRCIVVTL